ncbi:uncharacterized protein [Amphiura filiformis]|uniref:uncharacterized protein n=1 Tax=Amphiura filiformis TaxID=82378 RepID=UPI003B214F16
MLAIDALQEETAIYLINNGININHRYWGGEGKQSARDLASENGLQLVVQLIDSMLPVSQQLFYAVGDGTLDKVKQLIGHIDADMNMKVNQYGEKSTGTAAYTLLLIAIRNGHEDVGIFLVEQGIDTSFKHQVWERVKADSEPVLVESFDALRLAGQNNMHTLEHILMRKQNVGLSDSVKKDSGYTNHERSAVTAEQPSSEYGQSQTKDMMTNLTNVEKDHAMVKDNAWADSSGPSKLRRNKRACPCVIL